MSRTLTAYLAGPMSGIEDFNWPAFERAAKMLRGSGWDVISPAEMDMQEGINPDDYPKGELPLVERHAVMADDFREILQSCEAIIFLPGWEDSKGALAEFVVGFEIGLELWEIGFDDYVASGFFLVKLRAQPRIEVVR